MCLLICGKGIMGKASLLTALVLMLNASLANGRIRPLRQRVKTSPSTAEDFDQQCWDTLTSGHNRGASLSLRYLRQQKRILVDTIEEGERRDSSLGAEVSEGFDWKTEEEREGAMQCYDALKTSPAEMAFVTGIQMQLIRILGRSMDLRHQWLNETWKDISWPEINLLLPEEKDCSSSLPSLCLSPNKTRISSSVTLATKQSLSLVLSYAVALEFVVLDEALHGNRTRLMREAVGLLEAMKSLAFDLMKGLEQCGETPDAGAIREMTLMLYGTEDSSLERMVRGVAFFRQIEKGIRYLVRESALLECNYL